MKKASDLRTSIYTVLVRDCMLSYRNVKHVTVWRNPFYRVPYCTCHSVQTHPAENATQGGTIDLVGIHISLHIQWASFESFLCIFITTISMTWRIMTRESNTNSLARIAFTSVFIKRPHILPTRECLSYQWSVNYILDCVVHQSVNGFVRIIV